MVSFPVGDEKKTDLVHFIDFASPRNNEFLVVNQFTIAGTKQPRRPDLVAFINGLPLAVIELKNPANVQTDVWDAFNQLQTYKDEISDLFNSNEALVVSDGWTARVGSLTANAERMLPWRTIANQDDRPRLQMELETVVRGFFKHRSCSSTTCATLCCSSRMATRSSRRLRATTSSTPCVRPCAPP
jgi:type I restriction enzyme R subunit